MEYSLKQHGDVTIIGNIKVKDFLKLSSYKKLTAAQAALFDKVVCHARLITVLREIMKRYPSHKLTITDHGGYRPAKPVDLNKMVNGASGSMHKNGSGADIILTSPTGVTVDTAELAVIAENVIYKLGYVGGVGIYAKGNKHIHVDCGVRSRWSAWFESYSGNGINTQGGRPCTLRKGNKAAGVRLLQRKLNALGYACGDDDGIFGAKTKTALQAYQKANSLKPDGIFGKNSNAKMQLLSW